ncbi:hypothetical protein [Pinisolibacter sp.]|uniref:hypothetical protein n=1 Tax=Pinisolibacter sp. TaxID=2172024 RepID=UPI002FDD20E0
MIVWAVAGLLVGWFLSRRLRVDSLGAFLVSSVALPLLVLATVRRIDPDVLWDYAAFWLAVQSSYFAANLLAERAKPTTPEADDGGALENA